MTIEDNVLLICCPGQSYARGKHSFCKSPRHMAGSRPTGHALPDVRTAVRYSSSSTINHNVQRSRRCQKSARQKEIFKKTDLWPVLQDLAREEDRRSNAWDGRERLLHQQLRTRHFCLMMLYDSRVIQGWCWYDAGAMLYNQHESITHSDAAVWATPFYWPRATVMYPPPVYG